MKWSRYRCGIYEDNLWSISDNCYKQWNLSYVLNCYLYFCGLLSHGVIHDLIVHDFMNLGTKRVHARVCW